MRPIILSFTPLDDNTTYFATGLTGAGPFTPTTASTSDSLAHQVTLTSAANLSAISFTIVGTDADSKTQTEVITGPNATTVAGSKYFKSIVSITAGATLGANTMDVGVKDIAVSATIPVNWLLTPVNIGLGAVISGTINYTIQHTFEELYDVVGIGEKTLKYPAQGTWFPHASMAAKTANSDGNYAAPIRATRLLINSLTAGATIQYSVLQGAL